ncbi:DUF554 domain-containing protein [Myxococcota bacterium]|nr:DUF554 domain-containing protein [Myxococcota bacterium]
MILAGTALNVLTVAAGSLLGAFFGSKIPERISRIVFQAIGLFTLFIGMSMALKSQRILIPVFSLILGSALGEWLDLDAAVGRFGAWVKRRLGATPGTSAGAATFSDGMITAFLLFCVGSMTILGAFEEGTRGDSSLLITKAVMDGFSSLALASALGIGVLFSIVPLLVFQGGLTLAAAWLGEFVPLPVIAEMSAVGGLMLLGLGLSILEIKKIKVVNMLPALVFAVALAAVIL